MRKKVNIEVGTLEDMGRRFVSAWHRLDGGRGVRDVSEPVVDAERSFRRMRGITCRARRARKSK